MAALLVGAAFFGKGSGVIGGVICPRAPRLRRLARWLGGSHEFRIPVEASKWVSGKVYASLSVPKSSSVIGGATAPTKTVCIAGLRITGQRGSERALVRNRSRTQLETQSLATWRASRRWPQSKTRPPYLGLSSKLQAATQPEMPPAEPKSITIVGMLPL